MSKINPKNTGIDHCFTTYFIANDNGSYKKLDSHSVNDAFEKAACVILSTHTPTQGTVYTLATEEEDIENVG